MRVALWLLSLFAMAVAVALFAGDNQGTITLFWPPYRLDLSLNLMLLLLALLFVTLHLALRSLAALFAMPGHARRWRIQHQERSVYAALLDALSHLVAGRFIRARKAAETVLDREDAMARLGQTLGYSGRLRALAHLLAAESAQALQDRTARAQHCGWRWSRPHGGMHRKCGRACNYARLAGPWRTAILMRRCKVSMSCRWARPAGRLPCACA